ncbi:MAG: hypothetical protein MZV63_63095 [Marinilabiliales bacterium]|nr:hypothetical protein [Marinilabiliales bacterium]
MAPDPRRPPGPHREGPVGPAPGHPRPAAPWRPSRGPGHKAYFEVEDTCRKAGVLVLLYVKDGTVSRSS